MIRYEYIMPMSFKSLLLDPENAMAEMFGISKVYEQLPAIINDMVGRHFSNGRNPDGSPWKDLSAATKNLRFQSGIAKINPFKRNAFQDILQASGDYKETLSDIETAAFNKVEKFDIYGQNNELTYTLSADKIPGLWNEFAHKASGAINTNTIVPKRSVLYFDKQAEMEIISMVEKSLGSYWL